MAAVVSPEVSCHGTVVQDMKQRLVLFAELACRVLPFVPEVEIGVVW